MSRKREAHELVETRDEITERRPLPAPKCRCERSMPDSEGTCARCGRTVPIAAALAKPDRRRA